MAGAVLIASTLTTRTAMAGIGGVKDKDHVIADLKKKLADAKDEFSTAKADLKTYKPKSTKGDPVIADLKKRTRGR